MRFAMPWAREDVHEVLQSSDCYYNTWASINDIDIFDQLTPKLADKCDRMVREDLHLDEYARHPCDPIPSPVCCHAVLQPR